MVCLFRYTRTIRDECSLYARCREAFDTYVARHGVYAIARVRGYATVCEQSLLQAIARKRRSRRLRKYDYEFNHASMAQMALRACCARFNDTCYAGAKRCRVCYSARQTDVERRRAAFTPLPLYATHILALPPRHVLYAVLQHAHYTFARMICYVAAPCLWSAYPP